MREGTRISIKEKIAGIPCKANGIVTSINKHKLLRWEAVYSVFGLSWLKINAGVNWKLNELNDSITKLSANVWANFPDKFRYKLMWFFIKKIFNGIEKDYDHALTELRYLKSKLENK